MRPTDEFVGLLQHPISLAQRHHPATWIDGSQHSYLLASMARCRAFSTAQEWSMAVACAMGSVFFVTRVRVVPHTSVLHDVDTMVGAVDEEVRRRAYAAYLVALQAQAEGHGVLLSPTGADAVLCTAVRYHAAFDDWPSEDEFALRRSLWGRQGILQRYSCLVGEEVKPRRGEHVLDTMQRYEIRLAKDTARAECTVGKAAGISVRHPFLDGAVSGYTTALPASVRYQHGKRPFGL